MRKFPILVIFGFYFGCTPQASTDFMNIPEPSEYMRGFFPMKVVFDEKRPNEMVVLMAGGGNLGEFRLLAISMPVGQKVWEYSITGKQVRDMAPDPDGGVWVFVEEQRATRRGPGRDFKILKILNGENITSVDIPDTVYTDWYSFVVLREAFVGKPVPPHLYFGVCSRSGELIRSAPKFKNLKEYYEAFKKYSGIYNFRKFVAVINDRLYSMSEALDTMEIYDLNNGELIRKVGFGKPEMIPTGPGKAVINNRVVSMGSKGDTVWVLTLKDIRYYYDGNLVYLVDFGDKRFLTGTVKRDTFYWITYDKAVRLSSIHRYRIVKAENIGG